MLDGTDRSILHQIQQNARKQITDIASAIGVSDNTVRNRLMSLEDEGVISGYSADISYDRAGIQHHYIFICTASVSERSELVEEVKEMGQVVEVTTLMTGRRNVLIRAVGDEKGAITELAMKIDSMGLEVVDEELIRDRHQLSYAEFDQTS